MRNSESLKFNESIACSCSCRFASPPTFYTVAKPIITVIMLSFSSHVSVFVQVCAFSFFLVEPFEAFGAAETSEYLRGAAYFGTMGGPWALNFCASDSIVQSGLRLECA